MYAPEPARTLYVGRFRATHAAPVVGLLQSPTGRAAGQASNVNCARLFHHYERVSYVDGSSCVISCAGLWHLASRWPNKALREKQVSHAPHEQHGCASSRSDRKLQRRTVGLELPICDATTKNEQTARRAPRLNFLEQTQKLHRIT